MHANGKLGSISKLYNISKFINYSYLFCDNNIIVVK